MSDSIKAAKIGAKATIIAAVIGVIVSLGTFFLGQQNIEKKTIETLSMYFDSVDKDMSYKETLQVVYESSQQKDKIIDELTNENTELEKQVLSIPNFEIRNASLISDGLKIQDSYKDSIIVIDNANYYSESALNTILKNKLSYDSNQNSIFYNSTGENVHSETKIDLFDTNVLYDGVCFQKILPSDGETFSMGSSTYSKGFLIYDDHSLFGEGDGYALFDLQGKYSKISFDVGRTINEYEKQDVTLKVYLNDEYVTEYSLSGQSPPVSLTLDLNYANNMKLEITGGSKVIYGFANVVLNY